MAAIERANPEIKNPNRIYPGQVILLPGALIAGSGNTDIDSVDRGDMLIRLAARFGTTAINLLKLNPEVKDASIEYDGYLSKDGNTIVAYEGRDETSKIHW